MTKFRGPLVLASALAVASAMAGTAPLAWNELSEAPVVTLTAALFLPFHDGDTRGIHVAPGTVLQFLNRTSLGEIGVTQFELRPAICRAPSESTTMVIVGPKGSEVGVQIEADCHFEVYVEDRDLTLPSFFTVTR